MIDNNAGVLPFCQRNLKNVPVLAGEFALNGFTHFKHSCVRRFFARIKRPRRMRALCPSGNLREKQWDCNQAHECPDHAQPA